MRRAPTPAEEVLWERVRGSGAGARIRRQHPIEGFLTDFACLSANLVIEVDGGIHQEVRERDEVRAELMERLGYKTIRFTNEQVLKQTDWVVATIRSEIQKRLIAQEPPSPPEKGAGG